MLSKDLVNTGLLQHIKGIERKPGSFADLLLGVKDPKTGAATLFCCMLHCWRLESKETGWHAQACR